MKQDRHDLFWFLSGMAFSMIIDLTVHYYIQVKRPTWSTEYKAVQTFCRDIQNAPNDPFYPDAVSLDAKMQLARYCILRLQEGLRDVEP